MGSTSAKKRKGRNQSKNFLSWFEIPALDFDQAVDFYNQIFGIQMEQHSTKVNSMAFFPVEEGIGGAIIAGPGSVPGDTGPLLYLDGGDDLNDVLDRVENAGGRIIMSKTLIGEDAGYYAIFLDNQGNKLALFSKT